jgi:D-sedoheptulose 7-phosphate isomerase
MRPDAEGAALVADRLAAHVDVVRALEPQAETIARIATVIAGALGTGRKVLVFGNGGSAADAQHLAGELLGRYQADRAPLPAIALTTNSSTLTAIANDYDYSRVFSRQVEALGQPGDVAIGLSTSGRSPNVLEALRLAKKQGLVTIALTGAAGLQAGDSPDLCLPVPSTDTARVQEVHILAIHCICELIERAWTTR